MNVKSNTLKQLKIVVFLEYLSDIWRVLEILLINYKIIFNLVWSDKFVKTNADGSSTSKIAITD